MDNINEIILLTPQQRAAKKYYEKIKNNPNYIQQRRRNCLKYYHKIKDDEEYKQKVSDYKRNHYRERKDVLQIIV